MRITAGERRALWCLVPILVAFLPPVTGWAAGVRARVFGLPFLIFWNAAAIVLTSILVTAAFRIKERVDGRSDRLREDEGRSVGPRSDR